jgi:hypothetical protein
MNALDIDCDGCNAEAGEPCREWCIGEPVESEERECTHSLCIEGTRRWPAKYKITQVWRTSAGTPITRETWTCTHHTEVMLQILDEGDKIQRLHARGE